MFALLTEMAIETTSMARKSKWIEAESLDESATTFAQRALDARLNTVYSWLEQAADDTETPVESVHQLRVSTRRATAVLQLFEDWLPRRRARWFRKHLKQMRQTAGEARDLDVLAAQLCEYCNANQAAGCPELQGRVAEARQAAQPAIRELHQENGRSAVSSPAEKARAENARGATSKPFVRRFRKWPGRGYVRWPTIFSPRPRGISKTFWPCTNFGSPASGCGMRWKCSRGLSVRRFRKELYPLVEELQKKLGDINDRATHRDRYLAWHDDTTDESQRQILSTLISLESSALQTSIRAFRDWFTAERAAELKSRFWQEVGHDEAESTQLAAGAIRVSLFRPAFNFYCVAGSIVVSGWPSAAPGSPPADSGFNPVSAALKMFTNRPPVSYQPWPANRHQRRSSTKPSQRSSPALKHVATRRFGNGCW